MAAKKKAGSKVNKSPSYGDSRLRRQRDAAAKKFAKAKSERRARARSAESKVSRSDLAKINITHGGTSLNRTQSVERVVKRPGAFTTEPRGKIATTGRIKINKKTAKRVSKTRK